MANGRRGNRDRPIDRQPAFKVCTGVGGVEGASGKPAGASNGECGAGGWTDSPGAEVPIDRCPAGTADSVTPYYADDWVTIYHADCREILPSLVADVLVTDPPYGVRIGAPGIGMNGRNGKHGLLKAAYATYDDTYENYCTTVVPVIAAALEIAKRGAVFVGPHLQELPKASAIGGIYCRAASGRHPWGFRLFLPILFYGTDPTLFYGARPNVFESTASAEPSIHPVPKPMSWMRWLVELASLPGETVLDPFCGSGTTLRAAKDHGRRAVGIEIEERYCHEASERCAQEVLAV